VTAPGYFGKVVTHGDFVQRRLAPAFVTAWDRWLQAGMVHSQATLGPAWLPAYLNSPVWHFALAGGMCGPDAMAGVMIPSVDRVGRYFPLTVAGAVASGADDVVTDLFVHSAGWFDALMGLALGSLAQGYSIERMDAALVALAPGQAPGCADALAGRALFWTAGSRCTPAMLLVRDALPGPDMFAAMLAGD
jgi:type VI secretion system protein ImpM